MGTTQVLVHASSVSLLNYTVRMLQLGSLKIFTFAPLAPNLPTEPGEPGAPRLACNQKYQLKGAH